MEGSSERISPRHRGIPDWLLGTRKSTFPSASAISKTLGSAATNIMEGAEACRIWVPYSMAISIELQAQRSHAIAKYPGYPGGTLGGYPGQYQHYGRVITGFQTLARPRPRSLYWQVLASKQKHQGPSLDAQLQENSHVMTNVDAWPALQAPTGACSS